MYKKVMLLFLVLFVALLVACGTEDANEEPNQGSQEESGDTSEAEEENKEEENTEEEDEANSDTESNEQAEEEAQEENEIFSLNDAIKLVGDTYFNGNFEHLDYEILEMDVAYRIVAYNADWKMALNEYIVANGEIEADFNEVGIDAYDEVLLTYAPDYYDYVATEDEESYEDTEQEQVDFEPIVIEDLSIEPVSYSETENRIRYKVVNNTTETLSVDLKVAYYDQDGKSITSTESFVYNIGPGEYKYDETILDTYDDPNIASYGVEIIDYY